MTENNDILNQLNDLDSMSVEEIAENYSALDKGSQKRIVAQCMRKTGIPHESVSESYEETVSGTEIYKPRRIGAVLAYVAVFAIVITGGSKILSIKNSPLVNSADMSEEIQIQETSSQTATLQTELKESKAYITQTVTAVSTAESTTSETTARKSAENTVSEESELPEKTAEQTVESPPTDTQNIQQAEQENSNSSPEIPANTESTEQKTDKQAETAPVVNAEIIVEQPVTTEPVVVNPVIIPPTTSNTKADVLCFEDCVSTLVCADGYETQYYYKFNGYSCDGTRYHLSRANGLNFWYSIDGKKVSLGYADGTSKTAEIIPDECGFELKWENGDMEYFRLAYPNEFNTFLYGEDEDSLPLRD